MRARIDALAVSLLAASLTPRVAAAQDAVSLFRQGRSYVEAGNYKAACPLFATAHKLDKQAFGIALNLAECYEKIGKVASAFAAYQHGEYLARRAADTERADIARQRAAALEPRLAKLTISAAPTPGLQVRREDQDVAREILGVAFPVDSGMHRIEASAPGFKPWSTVVTVEKDGVAVSVQIPPLEKLPGGGVAGVPFRWTGQRIAGLGVGLAGVGALIAGGALGGAALAKYNATKSECSPTRADVCTSSGVAQRATALKMADASTGLLVGGGVAAAVGLVVILTARSDASTKTGGVLSVEASPVAGAGAAGVLLRGAW